MPSKNVKSGIISPQILITISLSSRTYWTYCIETFAAKTAKQSVIIKMQ